MNEAILTATWNFENMHKKMLPALLATDLADLLVESGIPFRDAHHIVGHLVGEAAKQKMEFTDLSNEIWEKAGVRDVEKIKNQLTLNILSAIVIRRRHRSRLRQSPV
jgi:argininosuccinate lyase